MNSNPKTPKDLNNWDKVKGEWAGSIEESIDDDGRRGLIAGYKPNRLSLYILMLATGRDDELMKTLYKDMEEYKIK